MIVLDENNFETVIGAKSVAMIDLWAAWCGPCQMLGPVISQIAEEHANDLKVGKVNVDEEPELAAMFGISSIPNVILFKNGKAVKNSVGFKPKEALEEFIK